MLDTWQQSSTLSCLDDSKNSNDKKEKRLFTFYLIIILFLFFFNDEKKVKKKKNWEREAEVDGSTRKIRWNKRAAVAGEEVVMVKVTILLLLFLLLLLLHRLFFLFDSTYFMHRSLTVKKMRTRGMIARRIRRCWIGRFRRGGGQRSPIDSKMIFPSWSSVSLWRSRSKFAILWCFWSWSFWLVLACVCLSVALWLFWRPPTKKRISTTTFFPRWAYRCAVYLWTHTKVLIFLPVSMGQRITAVRDIFKNPQNG